MWVCVCVKVVIIIIIINTVISARDSGKRKRFISGTGRLPVLLSFFNLNIHVISSATCRVHKESRSESTLGIPVDNLIPPITLPYQHHYYYYCFLSVFLSFCVIVFSISHSECKRKNREKERERRGKGTKGSGRGNVFELINHLIVNIRFGSWLIHCFVNLYSSLSMHVHAHACSPLALCIPAHFGLIAFMQRYKNNWKINTSNLIKEKLKQKQKFEKRQKRNEKWETREIPNGIMKIHWKKHLCSHNNNKKNTYIYGICLQSATKLQCQRSK